MPAALSCSATSPPVVPLSSLDVAQVLCAMRLSSSTGAAASPPVATDRPSGWRINCSLEPSTGNRCLRDHARDHRSNLDSQTDQLPFLPRWPLHLICSAGVAYSPGIFAALPFSVRPDHFSFCLCFRAEPILPVGSVHLPAVLENLRGWVLAPIGSPPTSSTVKANLRKHL